MGLGLKLEDMGYGKSQLWKVWTLKNNHGSLKWRRKLDTNHFNGGGDGTSGSRQTKIEYGSKFVFV